MDQAKQLYYLTNKNEVFREAYEAIIEENERYANFYNTLSERVKSITKPIVYLEGRTDEKYFKKAMEVFEYDEIDIDFQWIGHIDEAGNEAFTGSGSLNQGMQFIKGRHPKVLQFFLFDCDTKRQESDEENIVVMTIPFYSNHTIMNKGIENALELDGVELDDFYEEHTKYCDYGKVVITKDFDKMKMCDYICGLDSDTQKMILINLKSVIDRIILRMEQQ